MKTLLLAVLGVMLATTAARADEAIAYGEGGLRIGESVAYAGPVTAAAYDAALDLVWINTKGTLQVVDLRVSPPKLTVIAKKMPEGGFEVSGGSTATSGNDYAFVFPALDTKKAKFRAREGVYGELDIDPDSEKAARKAIKKIKVVGKKWLKTLKKRKPHAVAAVAARTSLGKITLPAGVGECEDEDSCGELEAFGATALQLVVTQYSCGDACFMGCALYDPKTKKLASPQETSTWGTTAQTGTCDGYLFSGDGATYLVGSHKCTYAKGVTCTDDTPWIYAGWTAP